MSQLEDRQNILKTNELFYRALGTRDIDLMRNLWVRDERSGCVHPGWIVLRSWDAIMQSWENLFDPQDQVDIKISDINLDIKDSFATLTCVQEMIYIKREPVMFNLSQSTNLFEKKDGKWLMIFHHASPIPVTENIINDQNIQ